MLSYWIRVLVEAGWQALALFVDRPQLLIVPVVGAVATGALVYACRGKEAFMEHLKANICMAFGGAILTWILFIPWFMLHIPVDDLSKANDLFTHCAKRERSAVMGQQSAELQWKATQSEIAAMKPGDVSGADPQSQCWLKNNPIFPNPKLTGIVSANQALIFCNHRYDAPYEVAVTFDRDFVEGGGTVLGPSVSNVRDGKKQGTTYHWVVDSPSLLAFEPIVITANSKTDQAANAVSGDIKSLH